MNNNFLCPYCKGHLKVNEQIVFSTSTQNGKSGLTCLSPQIGNYAIVHHPSFEINKGELVSFYCPICHSNLTSNLTDRLVKVMMVNDSKEEFTVLFSGVLGEKCTYTLSQTQNEVMSYGVDSSNYVNFFGASPEY